MTVKGAYVLRGADGNPHAVKLLWSRVQRIPSGVSKPVPIEEGLRVDAAPTRDLFVPFEVPISDLDPGWYRIRVGAQVDGGRTWEFAGRPFSVPWPRREIRRGTVRVGERRQVGDVAVTVDRLELAEATVVVWRPERGAEASGLSLDVAADGVALEPLPEDAAPATTHAAREVPRAVFYPMPASAATATIVARLGRDAAPPVEVRLP